MFRYKLLYVAILIALLQFAILYPDPLAVLLFVMMICFPLVSYVVHLITIPFLSCSIESPSAITTTDAHYPFYFHIKNRSLFPIVRCVAVVEVRHLMLDISETKHYSFAISSHCHTREKQELVMPHHGTYELHLKQLICYSFFSLFQIKKRIRNKTTLIRLPSITPISPPDLLPNTPSFDGDSFSQTTSGDDPSEIFAIREFKDGDSMKKIHWKLSSKTDSFLVRDDSFPLTKRTILFFAVTQETADDFPTRLDEALAFTLSLGLFFVSERIPYTFFWYDTNIKQLKHMIIETEEQCYFAFYQLLLVPLSSTLPECLPEEFQQDSYFKLVATPSVSLHLENAYEY